MDLEDTDRALRELAATLDGIRTERQQARGRQASLTALRDAALADDRGVVQRWLDRAGLAEAPRLMDVLAVEPGWETAVERVLDAALRATITADLDHHAAALADPGTPAPAGLALLERGAADRDAPAPASDTDTLAARVQAPWPLDHLLGGIRVADDLATALAGRAALAPGERLITPTGIQVGRDWLRLPGAAATDGVLARAESLKALEAALADLGARETAARAAEETRQAARAALLRSRDELDRAAAALEHERATARAELASLRARAEHREERLRALADERDELNEQIEDASAEMEDTREHLHALLAEIDTLAGEREALTGERASARATLAAMREQERDRRDCVQGLRVSVESGRAAQTATRQGLARAGEQRVQLQERRDELLDALEASREPLAEQRARLDEQLILRVEVEAALGAARERLATLDAAIRALEQERQQAEQAARAGQSGLDALRLERQDRLVRRQTLEEQLAAAGAELPALLAGLDPAADETSWQERLARVTARIQRLGAINLAAIDEYREQSERKTWLDAQHADISESLDTLEQAIRRIDRETRNRFKETYEQVDAGFRQIFPRLFGGGQASLELTDADLLETGITVMARPPGKRNSTIHLLSGGEKALTAVALVFAIFELNPAPFCMLDEVDAPLDDANVGRFCELVRSMSDRVQFIFISHNKVTMAIADHLLGVTMQEPGVSRLVTVDMEAAARLAGLD